jgi:hypothetical protein
MRNLVDLDSMNENTLPLSIGNFPVVSGKKCGG